MSAASRPMKAIVRLPYVKWREGRPRWEPNARLAKAGWKGEDLRHPDGRWLSFEEARRWVEARMALVAARRAGTRIVKATASDVVTMAALFERWIDLIEKRLAREEKAAVPLTLAPRTVRDYAMKARWLLKFDPVLAQAPAEAISPKIGRDLYQRARLAKGNGMAAAVCRVASIVYSWGMADADLAPLKGHPFRAMRMRAAAPRVRAGTIEEMRALVAAADAIGKPAIGDAIVLGLWTGQRQQDRLALVETQFIGNGGRIVFRQAKTGKRVTVPAAADLVERLAAARARKRAQGVTSLHVVVSPHTGQPYAADHYRHEARDVIKAAAEGVRDDAGGWKLAPTPSLADFRDADLRDTSLTWLALAGCTLDEICSISGHSRRSALTVLEHYIDPDAGFSMAAIEKLEAWHAREAV